MFNHTTTTMAPATAVTTPGVRRTPSGKYEVRLKDSSAPKGYAYRTFETAKDAADFRELHLRANAAPARQTAQKAPQAPKQLSVVLRHYLTSETARIAASDRPQVETLQDTLSGVTMNEITTGWADGWVRRLKQDRLAPGTIRKKVESLARALDWWFRQEHQDGRAPANPLRSLPKGYSAYSQGEVKKGQTVPVDVKRDRRLNPGEYEKVEAQLSSDPDLLMLFRLIVHTGLRLREAYRLTRDDVKFQLRTIHVARSKTGAKRDVPMLRQLEQWLKDYLATHERELVFPWWSGVDDEDILKAITISLSKRFKTVFIKAGCTDLREHDLRHEATCRWMLMRDKEGRFLFRTEEVMKITGHQSMEMIQRYLSLRGSDLADRLE